MTTHPDDERLSAAFDGEGDLGDHAQCPECRARLDQLAAVARHIGAPVTDVPDTTAAVAAAIASARAGGGDGSSASGNVLPLARRARPPAWLAAVAGVAVAAVVAAVIAIPLSRSASDKATTATDLAAPSDIPQLEGADLGELDDTRMLAEAIAPVIGRAGPDELAARSGASSGAAAPGPAPFSAQDSDAGSGAGTQESSPAAKEANATSTSARATTARRGTRPARCAAAARDVGRDRIEALLYSAPTTWIEGQPSEGDRPRTPAMVLVFDGTARATQGSKSPRHTWLFVMARSDCRLLATATF